MYNQLHSHFDRRYPSSLVPPNDRSYELFLSDVTAVQGYRNNCSRHPHL